MSSSKAIDSAVLLAEAAGNCVLETVTGWSKLKEVVYMTYPLTEALRTELLSDHRLRFYAVTTTPHEKAEKGFIDDIEKVAICFPV
jgi:hypothetical protein